ncbi:MAG: AAA family ATPase [Eubacteriales bacterium]
MNDKNTQPPLKTEEESEGVSIRPFLEAILRFWYVILILALLGGALMFCRSYARYTPVYQSSVTFTVHTQEISSSGIGMTSYSFAYNRATAKQLSSTFPNIIKSNILQDILCNDLGMSYLPVSLSAASVAGTNMFTITAKGNDPQLTYDVLQSVIRNYPAVADYVIGNTELVILSAPEIPTEPSNVRGSRSQFLKGAVAGVLLGLLWALVYAILRHTVNTRTDIRQKLGQKCVGVLPRVSFKKYGKDVSRSVTVTNPLVGDGYREAVRALRNTVLKSASNGSKVIMVTSTAPSEGKTTTAVNLALSIAAMKKNVILVDADMRSPSVRKTLGVKPLEFDPSDRQIVKIARFSFPDDVSLSVMNFNTARFRLWNIARHDNLSSVFAILRKNYDFVIVDTSPVGLTSEAAVVGSVSDCALLVVRQDTVRTNRICASIDSMQSSDVKLLGCVLNDASESALGGHGYGYGYGYKYGYGYHYGYGYRSKYGYGSASGGKTE